jgi:hypothetical protein
MFGREHALASDSGRVALIRAFFSRPRPRPRRRVSLSLFLALAFASACHKRDGGDDIVVTSATCLHCQPAASVGKLESREMDETSGLVASALHVGLYYANNDSGDVARFFAIDEHGAKKATFTFSASPVTDCEEITSGPCVSGGTCLYIGDIGDNFRTRASIDVYRVGEPVAIADVTLPSLRFTLKYPDGAHDAEVLLVHPYTGAITIVTKEKDGPASVFTAPPLINPGPPIVLTKAGTLKSPAGSPRFTGASLHPQARGILLRTYTHVYFAPMTQGQTIADALQAPLCSLPIVREDQGESVAWRRDGTGFLTIGEGVNVSVNETRCDAP